MKKKILFLGFATVTGLLLLSRCGSSGDAISSYRQIERLGRPGINEALVLSSEHHAAFNSIAPSLDLSAQQAVADVRADVVAVLTAIKAYATTNGLLAASTVNNTAGGFLPDVLRINTARNFSATAAFTTLGGDGVNLSATNSYPGAYGSDFSGTAPSTPDVDRADPLRLSGGRMITDDVIDVTYSYLIAGLAAQIVDGVNYCGQGGNIAQGHHPLTGWTTCTTVKQNATFPFLAAPN